MDDFINLWTESKEKIDILQKRTELTCSKLESLNIDFYRNPNFNIITIKSNYISTKIAHEFGLVPDNHHNPKCFKIVVMEHVTMEKLNSFLIELEKSLLN